MEQGFNFYQNYFIGKFYEIEANAATTRKQADERAAQAAKIYLALRRAGYIPAYSLERSLCVLHIA